MQLNFYSFFHLKIFYKYKFGYREGDLLITEEISNKTLTLPISLKFSKEDQDHIKKRSNIPFNKIQ